ncbi:G/U mismatch-specific DNA glycosylase [soil metagenome]
MSAPVRPTREQIAAAHGRLVPDVIAPGLNCLFCGINPGLYSGAVGHHFARPGNRFWAALALSGFTDRRLNAYEEEDLLEHGLGITNLVERATATADEIGKAELEDGARALRRKVRRLWPQTVAFLGLGAYRVAFSAPAAVVGEQPKRIGDTRLWLLPNPSGLNAHYQVDALAEVFAALRRAVESGQSGR